LNTGDLIEAVDIERLHQRIREVASANPPEGAH